MSETYDTFKAYMCKTDFEHDARGAHDGARVYPSERALRRERTCVAECGIVEVTITLSRIVQAADFSAFRSFPTPNEEAAERE